ncbi:MAG TPA: hypothetical protein ENG51_10390, partial [Deltaproteobacteria bacterium]|nr:hypothetical protein [Deltaproteobacteria bacterium]
PKPQSINAFFYIKEDAEAIPKRWISLTGLKKYLNQESISSKDLTKPLQLYEPEPKSGIARNRKTKTSEIGKLYRVDHYRYRDGVSIITIISGTAENLNGIFTLGGERRTAIVREIETDPLENFALPQVNNRFLVYLMTPAIFRNGWYPERIISLLEKEGINLQLISAYIPNYIVISGWDIQKRAPKTLYRAVPEGSIYVFEVKKGNAQDAVKNFHGKNISDVNPEEGYGFALVGKI